MTKKKQTIEKVPEVVNACNGFDFTESAKVWTVTNQVTGDAVKMAKSDYSKEDVIIYCKSQQNPHSI